VCATGFHVDADLEDAILPAGSAGGSPIDSELVMARGKGREEEATCVVGPRCVAANAKGNARERLAT
jgi:hypothetical protein